MGAVYASVLRYKNVADDFGAHQIAHFIALSMPAFAICLVALPQDLFSEYNRFPEQLNRVSLLQYPRYNYTRFQAENLVRDSLLYDTADIVR